MSDSEVSPENLKRLRKARRLLQEDIAAIIGVPRESVSKIETGLRELAISERRLLEWYFFGKIPASVYPAVMVSTVNYPTSSVTFVW